MSTRTISLLKGGHKHVFRYVSGREGLLFDQLERFAEDPASPLNWLDAAKVAFRIAQNAADECRLAGGSHYYSMPALRPGLRPDGREAA